MLAYYYQKRMAKSKNEGEYYSSYSLGGMPTTTQNLSSTCRVCLREGSTSIYGEKTQEVIEALRVFGNITVSRDDYTKLLCSVCYKFIIQAMMFRKIAMQTDEFFQKHVIEEVNVKIETADQVSEDDYDLSDEYDASAQQPMNTPAIAKANALKKDSNNLEISHEKGNNVSKEKNDETENLHVACHVCNKVLMKNSLKQHLLLHDKDSKFICHVCGKTFKTNTNYHNHSWVHNTEFEFKCELCPYRANNPSLLGMHMKTHKREYLICTECPAKFLFRSNLNSHVRRKHRKPQFQCDVCKKPFHTKPLLKEHIEVVHLGMKKHACDHCDKTFKYRKCLLDHQNTEHDRKKSIQSRMPYYLLAENINKNPE